MTGRSGLLVEFNHVFVCIETFFRIIVYHNLIEVGYPVTCISMRRAQVRHNHEGINVDTAIGILFLRIRKALEIDHDVLPAFLGLYRHMGDSPELFVFASLPAPMIFQTLAQAHNQHTRIGRLILEVSHYVNVLQLLGHTDRFFQIDSYTECITAVSASLESHYFVGCIGSNTQNLVYTLVRIISHTGIAFQKAQAERTFFPLVVDTDFCIVIGIESDTCLCRSSHTHK